MKSLIFAKAFFIILSISITSTFADNKVEKSFDVDNFNKIFLRGPYEVHLRQTNKCGLTILAREDHFERLDISSDDGELSIELDGRNFRKTREVEVYIHFEELEKLEIEGAVDLICENQIKTSNLKIEFEGAGNVELNVKTDKIIAEIAGVGNFEIEGETEYHKVAFDGIGNYEAQDLRSKYTIVESNGIGSVTVFASNKFKGEANGIGSVEYYGDPKDVSINATGLGSVDRH